MATDRTADWVEWHRSYEDPSSSLSRRLRVVQEELHRAVDVRPGRLQLISMCAGQGRDVAGALTGHPRRDDIWGRLVELDARNVEIARAAVREAGLERVEVVQMDAAITDSYEGAAPADIILACGIFGNISDADVRRTVEHLPSLCAPGATVIWTRGRRPERDFSLTIREWFTECGFEETAYDAPADAHYRVGVHRLAVAPRPFQPGVRLFTFLR